MIKQNNLGPYQIIIILLYFRKESILMKILYLVTDLTISYFYKITNLSTAIKINFIIVSKISFLFILFKIMNQNVKICLIAIVLLICMTSQRLIHKQQTYEDQQNQYYMSMLNQQTNLKLALISINKEIEFLHQNLQQVNQLPSMKLIALQQALADERDFLYQLQQNQTIPLNLKVSECKNLTKEQADSISITTKNIQDQLKSIKNSLDQLKNENQQCNICKQLQRQYDWLNLYLGQLQSQQSAICPFVQPKATAQGKPQIGNIFGYANMTNLNAKNWILGNSTQSEFYLQKFNLFSRKNVTKCPLNKPYVLKNTSECTNCQGDLLFELSSQTCVICPKDTSFDSGLHICSSLANGTSSISGTGISSIVPSNVQSCMSGKYYNETLKKCVCPDNVPYFNGKQCISCILPMYFNKDASKCDNCPLGQAYDILKKVCAPCPVENPVLINGICQGCNKDQYYNLTNKKCLTCPKSMKYDSNKKLCVCVSEKPNFNGLQCIKCDPPQYFNTDRKNCQDCSNDKYFNQTTSKCQVCPKQTPVPNGLRCTICPTNSYWNSTAIKCQVCPKGQNLNSEGECQCPQDSPIYEGGICRVSCPQNSIYLPAFDTCRCQEQGAFFINSSCIVCSAPNFWNNITQNCQSCPNNYFYNATLKYCVTCPIGYAYNYTSQKCLKILSINQTKTVCLSNYVFNNQTKKCQCPKNVPFDDGKQCVVCYLPKFWSYNTKSCNSCPENQFYDINRLACVKCPDNTVLSGYKCLGCPAETFFDQNIKKCVSIDRKCNSNMIWNILANNCTCPQSLPFYDGKSCVSCFLPKFWNLDTKSCDSCPIGQFYNIHTYRCQYCPASSPLVSGYQCIPCPERTVYEKNTNTCIQIQTNGTGSISITNGAGNSLNSIEPSATINNKCKQTFIFDFSSNKCICPSNTPFDDGQKCVSCYLPRYWNLDLKKCESCPDGQKYDTTKLYCIKI